MTNPTRTLVIKWTLVVLLAIATILFAPEAKRGISALVVGLVLLGVAALYLIPTMRRKHNSTEEFLKDLADGNALEDESNVEQETIKDNMDLADKIAAGAKKRRD